MHYIHLILLSDFLQLLYSAREFYTKKQYFLEHKLFYTISLQQEHRLNPRNYSKQELIMLILVWSIDHDLNMHAKIHGMGMYR
jgi:hypothetical protein